MPPIKMPPADGPETYQSLPFQPPSPYQEQPFPGGAPYQQQGPPSPYQQQPPSPYQQPPMAYQQQYVPSPTPRSGEASPLLPGGRPRPISSGARIGSLVLDVDAQFLMYDQGAGTLSLLAQKKIRLQIQPNDRVKALVPLLQQRCGLPMHQVMLLPQPMHCNGQWVQPFVAQTAAGFEMSEEDDIGDMATNNEFLRVSAQRREHERCARACQVAHPPAAQPSTHHRP